MYNLINNSYNEVQREQLRELGVEISDALSGIQHMCQSKQQPKNEYNTIEG